jgi:CRISPR-associated protein Csb1
MPAIADDLIDRLLSDTQLVAIVLRQPLRPLVGDTIYPASYAAPESAPKNEKRPRYCMTSLRNGSNLCVVDSVPSQANRIEAALLADSAYEGLIPAVWVTVKLEDGSEGKKHVQELGHRATDGAALASTLAPELTDALAQARVSCAALARLSPTSLLMGVWDSRKNRTGLKLPRAFSATVEASEVSERPRYAQYNAAWHANQLDKDVLKAAGSKPAELGLDGVPSGDGLGGVVVHGAITRTAYLAATPLRANCAVSSDEKGKEKDHQAARYVAALGLVALTMPVSPWLRSGCNLVAKEEAVVELVTIDGKSSPLNLTHEQAVTAAKAAAKAFGIDKLAVKTGVVNKDTMDRFAKEVAKTAKSEGA